MNPPSFTGTILVGPEYVALTRVPRSLDHERPAIFVVVVRTARLVRTEPVAIDVEPFLRRVAENLQRRHHLFGLQPQPFCARERRCVSSSTTLAERDIPESANEHSEHGAANPLRRT
jgi:hypothetical protein